MPTATPASMYFYYQNCSEIKVNMLLLIFLCLAVCQVCANDLQITLIASSPFYMALRPTAKEIDFTAIQAVANAISVSLLAQQSQNAYLDMEVVTQQVDFISPSTSRLRFFVLATTIVQASDSVADEKQALDLLLTMTFTDSVAKADFVKQVRSASQLQNVTQAALAPVVSNSSAGTSGSKKTLSVLDIVLISISILIFLGIVYMVVEHHRDRGWLENQRMFTANEASHSPEHTLAYPSTPPSIKTAGRERQLSDMDGLSTTPSSPNSDSGANASGAPRQAKLTYSPRLTSVSSLPSTPIPLLPPSSLDVESLSHSRSSYRSERTIRFDQSTSPNRSCTGIKVDKRGTDCPAGKGATEMGGINSTESSEDVFHIDMQAVKGKDDSVEDDDVASKQSAASAISDWIKGIRVVSSNKSNLSQSSNISTASMAESSLGQSSLEQLSLEHSMADSSVGEPDLDEVVVSDEHIPV
ncbi:hypothetical protein MPSEU_000169800 [Mayamaea pseudoterrestris]|nr:hypothetical protein MPSEU_000169800 [Mayamaea pseudoterrestris]